MAVFTVFAQNFADLGFSIQVGQQVLQIGSVTFFTAFMFGMLILYLFEGPRAARLALGLFISTTVFYVLVVLALNNLVDTSDWVSVSSRSMMIYFWSTVAVIADTIFLALAWELLTRFKNVPLGIKVFTVVLGVYFLDALIFDTGAFMGDPRYQLILSGGLSVRAFLSLLVAPILTFYLHQEGYDEDSRIKPKRMWEVVNFRSDLEEKVRTMGEVIRSEKALADELVLYKRVVDAASDHIAITDPDGIVIYGNPMVEKLTGYSIDEIKGKKAGKLWGGLMPKEYYADMWQTIKNKKETFVGELVNIRKSGVKYDAQIKIAPILDEDGEIKYFVAIERDVTKEKQLDRMKDEFLSVASHELRTPLTAIDGLVSMIRDGDYGKVNEELKQPLEDINFSSQRLINLVNDLLNVTRIQSGRLKYSLSEFDIKAVIEETVPLLSVVAKNKNIYLTAKEIKSAVVQGDVDKVKQVLNNLIGNSLKFTDKGGITVSTREKGEVVYITVTDTGIGLKKEDQEKLFGKFQQMDSGKGRPEGTGLGLFISKELCRRMGGDLYLVSSESNKGSAFEFCMPIAKTETAKRVAKQIEEEAKVVPDQK